MFNLPVEEILKHQRVNTSFKNITNVAPSLLRTMGVRTTLQSGGDHVEDFAPFLSRLKTKQLLIRPFQYQGVKGQTTKDGRFLQNMDFILYTSAADFAKLHGTTMGMAGTSGKDHTADNSWGDIATATSPFMVSIRVVIDSGDMLSGLYSVRHTFVAPVPTLRDLFELLERYRDMEAKRHMLVFERGGVKDAV